MENKILIEFVPKIKTKSPFKRWLKKPTFPTQGKPFDFRLVVTNIGENIFPGGTIKNIKISSGYNLGGSISHQISREFLIPALNPSDKKEIEVGKITTLLEGLIWMGCSIEPAQADQPINAYQKELITGQVIDPQVNRWNQESFVLPQSQVTANKLNYWVVVLTALIFLDGVFGLKTIAVGMVTIIGKIFAGLASLFLAVK